jgi:hypothetical protein
MAKKSEKTLEKINFEKNFDLKVLVIIAPLVIVYCIYVPGAIAVTKERIKKQSEDALKDNSTSFVQRYHVYPGLKKSAKKVLTFTKKTFPKEKEFQNFLEKIVMNNLYIDVSKMRDLEMFHLPAKIEKGIEMNGIQELNKSFLNIRGGNNTVEFTKILGIFSILLTNFFQKEKKVDINRDTNVSKKMGYLVSIIMSKFFGSNLAPEKWQEKLNHEVKKKKSWSNYLLDGLKFSLDYLFKYRFLFLSVITIFYVFSQRKEYLISIKSILTFLVYKLPSRLNIFEHFEKIEENFHKIHFINRKVNTLKDLLLKQKQMFVQDRVRMREIEKRIISLLEQRDILDEKRYKELGKFLLPSEIKEAMNKEGIIQEAPNLFCEMEINKKEYQTE